MKQAIMIFLLLSTICVYSQIKMTVTPENNKCMLDCKMKITFINTSKNNYMIPLDTRGIRAYDGNIFWLDFKNSKKADKSLCLELSIKKSNTEFPLEATTRKKDIDMDLINFDSLSIIAKKENDEYQEKLENWKVKYKIKDKKKAEKNMFLNENLLFLESGQEFSYYIKFDTSFELENNYFSPESYYLITPDTKYYAVLKLKIPGNIRSYFTTEQIEKYKKYKIFTGDIISKPLSLVLENNKYLLNN